MQNSSVVTFMSYVVDICRRYFADESPSGLLYLYVVNQHRVYAHAIALRRET